MSASDISTIRAAGGLIWREGKSGADVVVIHRPAYDDWSFPKGKLEPGEGLRGAALREIEEETSLRCELGADLGYVTYEDALGRPKVVRYWRMRVVDGDLRAANEVDDARWVPVEEAREMLTYWHDRKLIDRSEATPVIPDNTLLLVRHAKAGSRSRWDKPDELRPLSGAGRRQAKGLIEPLSADAPTVFLSSPAVRCMETLRPAADALRIKLIEDDRLAEGSLAEGVFALAREVATRGETVAMCSHGDVIMDVIGGLLEDDVPNTGDGSSFAKGSWWEIKLSDGGPTEIRSFSTEAPAAR